MTEERKKIDKLYKQIDALAKSGKDQVFEYYLFIDDVVSKSQYGYFEQCLDIYYKINIISYLSIDDVKKKTWPEILFQTNSTFQTKLKKIYDKKLVYQNGYNIYYDDNLLIGQIKELDQYSPEIKYLRENSDFAKAMNKKITYLEVIKPGVATASIINTNDTTLSNDQNLLNNYLVAIDYLLENGYVLLTGHWDDYGYWDDNSTWID